MKGKMLLITAVGLALLIAACTCPLTNCPMQSPSAAKVAAPAAPGHPELSDQEKLIACAQCHQDVTPALYNEWFNSTHGIANVKCYQCHGTFEDLHTTPDPARCSVCHAGQFHKSVPGKTCWECHPAHSFKVHQ